MQSPTGRSDHSRDDSLIADDASSTGNKDDDDDDDEDDANDENDGFSRDPERLKAFNVSNLVLPNIRISQQILFTRSLGALRAPTSSWRPFGPALGPSGLLDFALHALRLGRSGHVTHATVIE